MNRKTWTTLAGILVVGLMSQHAHAQSYSPGDPPSVGDIQSLCVAQYPAPQTRTDVGIGEVVGCWIDTSTWSDTDIYTDAYGNQSNVSDTLGEICWSVSGPGSVYPVMNDYTYLTIDLADADGDVTVIAMVSDSGTLGVDPPARKEKAFKAKIPTEAVILQATDQPPAAWNPGNAKLGASTAFLFQVLPNTVNLDQVSMQVAFGGAPDFKWPDGTKDPVAASIFGPWKTTEVGETPNLKTYPMTQALVPVMRLAGKNFNWTNAGNLQYKDKTDWKGVGIFSTVTNYRGVDNPNPPPALFQTALAVNASDPDGTIRGKWGGWQGPWE